MDSVGYRFLHGYFQNIETCDAIRDNRPIKWDVILSGVLAFSFLAGLSVSTAHIMPEAIFPDVIEWDELRTNTRREGTYYGAVNLIRKLSSALAIFIALQILGWFGYQAPPDGITLFHQTPNTLLAIRLITGPLVAFLLLCAVGFASFYPLTRDRQARIHRTLLRRQRRAERKGNPPGQP